MFKRIGSSLLFGLFVVFSPASMLKYSVKQKQKTKSNSNVLFWGRVGGGLAHQTPLTQFLFSVHYVVVL